MSTRTQIILSVVIVGVASAVVALQMRGDGDSSTAGGIEGHDHAAMVAGGGEAEPVRLTREDARRIGVTFSTVERRALPLAVEALGTVAYDETRLSVLNPKVDGWVERLHVDFTGAPVRAGQALLEVYSPRLVSAQEELILAARLLDEATEGRAARNAEALLDAARRRLEYWDVSPEEIRAIEETREVRKGITLHAPASGVVVEKNVVEGDRIMPGMAAYRIADLSTVWIEADVFEKDLGSVREGQIGAVTFEAFPGRRFQGRVTYVYPTVSIEARTGRVRLEIPNPDGSLRPGMYARIELRSAPQEPTLVVPRSALLSTGARSLVFVEAMDGTLVPREVTAGRTSGPEVEILEGLSEGERVVSSAAFLVDAESNLGSLGQRMVGDAEPRVEMPAMDTTGVGSAHGGEMDDGHSGHGGRSGGGLPPAILP